MKFKSETELKNLSPTELEEERSRALREMQSPRFAKDTERQILHAKPTDHPESRNVEEPTLKQIEDYIGLLDKVSAEVNPPS